MVRRELEQGEDEQEYLEEGLGDYQIKELFLGECTGIALIPRGPNDSHICFMHLTEDDGCWFQSSGIHSTFWLTDLAEVLAAVREWLEANADPDSPTRIGWKFRPK